MKIFIIFAVFILAVNSVTVNEHWLTFKNKYMKSYDTEEELVRFEIFKANLKRIEEHNAKYEKGKSSYTMGVNKFADMTEKEFLDMLNHQMASKPNVPKNNVDLTGVEPPESIDWREKNAVLKVKDQKDCSSCWAFSTTGALEAYNVLVNNVSISLSEQELVDCSTLFNNNGCHGGSMRNAFGYVQQHGLASEKSYPYQAVDQECNHNNNDVVIRISEYKTVSDDEDDLKKAVGTIGPISAAMYADSELQLYEQGVFDIPTCQNNKKLLNHGVLVVGYDSGPGDYNRTDYYWIIKNSWGEEWGEKGYFRMIRNPTICGIYLDANFPVVIPK